MSYWTEQLPHKELHWQFSGPLAYNISHPPNYLSINKVIASDYDTRSPSTYTFTFSSPPGQFVAMTNR